MKESVSQVITDEGFGLPSPLAINARTCAEKMLEFMSDSENKTIVTLFAIGLINDLKSCFKEYRSKQLTRERMWEGYYKLRSSATFKDKWTKFLHDSINAKPCPIFFQFVTDALMKKLIEEHFPLSSKGKELPVQKLDYQEMNAIRYAAGYTLMAVKKKMQRSAHPLKKEITLCLADMEEDIG